MSEGCYIRDSQKRRHLRRAARILFMLKALPFDEALSVLAIVCRCEDHDRRAALTAIQTAIRERSGR